MELTPTPPPPPPTRSISPEPSSPKVAEGILCRICERDIATGFFEKHNETCEAVHRLEAEITEADESLNELRRTVLKINAQLAEDETLASYQGLPLLSDADPLQAWEDEQPARILAAERKSLTHRYLVDAAEILQIAVQVESPPVREEEIDLPWSLNRESEEKLLRINRWQKPTSSDPGLALLFNDVEDQLRRKHRAIARIQSTIRYSEKTRREWEHRVNQVLGEESSGSDTGSDGSGQGDISAETGGEVEGLGFSAPSPFTPQSRLLAALGHTHRPRSWHGATGIAFPHSTFPRYSAPSSPRARPPSALSQHSTPVSPTAELPPSAPLTIVTRLPSPTPILLKPDSPTSVLSKSESPILLKPESPTSSTLLKPDAFVPLKTDSPPPILLKPDSPTSLLLKPEHVSPRRGSNESTRARARRPSSDIPPSPLSPRIPLAGLNRGGPTSIKDFPGPPFGSALLKPDHISPRLGPADGVPRAHARRPSKAFLDMPLSPRTPSAALNRGAPPSIKDFEIIKPISRGAFGSVYLAKKVATGDYFAIKALKKSDMIAKNQITNVKAERTILMNQASSPYVVKLFFSFQSKEYLYLVMEYLSGGDCATLVKTLGGLPEDWARNYIAEVILGLEYLHARNIVHRDIKPDNLLIDAKGHLKLTDFGLSRIGLLNRQVAGPRPAYLNSRAAANQPPLRIRTTSSTSPMISPDITRQQGYFMPLYDYGSEAESSGSESPSVIPKHMRQLSIQDYGSADESSGSESAHHHHARQASTMSTDLPTPPSTTGPEPPKVVGTPDYLAPESILGLGNDDRTVDWWALGVVLYEFIYGVPPFHAETPTQVFDNIVSRRIDWHEDEVSVSAEARDLMDRLMCSKPEDRLGSGGAEEVKRHPFFADLDWATVTEGEASFVPQVTDPESTDYFDARGAVHGFHDEDAPQVTKPSPNKAEYSPLALQAMEQVAEDIAAQEDFGTFNFKNLPVLKQANDDMIRKLRVDSMVPIGQALETALAVNGPSKRLRERSRSRRKKSDLGGPPSPTTSNSSAASTPSRSSGAPTTPSIPPIPIMPPHLRRRPSELNALDRVKSSDEGELARRAAAPARIRAGSGSSVVSDRSTSMELWRQRRQVSLQFDPSHAGSGSGSGGSGSGSLPSSFGSPDMRGDSRMEDRTLDVLIAEDNPISQKILETLLTRMGCRCVCVEDGPQALAATMGSIRFDVIICDIHMPVVDGEQVAKMIRASNNHNQHTPIIAATSYEQYQSISEEGSPFTAILAKPISKSDLTSCLLKLGFELSHNPAAEHSGSEP